ncbi:ROK family protein [Jannaschia sp. R86511]|uniref:ROK family protein n=1 Tax=Jannaschia sp. R86511 TaxID=3093853 RepID=UPI0036D299A8
MTSLGAATSSPRPVAAGIEAGGTKFVCAIGTGPDDVVDSVVVPTTTPRETLARVRAFFDAPRQDVRVQRAGIASFGPLDLRPTSPTYGRITTTPKPGWAGTDLLGSVRSWFEVPTRLDTDVNGAAYGEHCWGAARDVDSSAYLTVGTGVGGGAVVHGRVLGGQLHPEMGHLHVTRHPDDDFAGSCPFHGDCLEGLASGPAIRARTGRAAHDLGDQVDHVVALEAWYLAQLVTAVALVVAPERVVIGGGVLGLPGLLPAIRRGVLDRLDGALDGTPVAEDVDAYLVAPQLGSMSGVLGAIAMTRPDAPAPSPRTDASPGGGFTAAYDGVPATLNGALGRVDHRLG